MPLAVLAVSALLGGYIHLPLDQVLPAQEFSAELMQKHSMVGYLSVGVSLAGVLLAWLIFGRSHQRAIALQQSGNPILVWWREAFGFDWLYDKLFVKPYLAFVRINAKDIFDQAIGLIPETFRILNGWFAQSQNGMVRWYAAALGAGAVFVVAAVVLI